MCIDVPLLHCTATFELIMRAAAIASSLVGLGLRTLCKHHLKLRHCSTTILMLRTFTGDADPYAGWFVPHPHRGIGGVDMLADRKSTRLNSSHVD